MKTGRSGEVGELGVDLLADPVSEVVVHAGVGVVGGPGGLGGLGGGGPGLGLEVGLTPGLGVYGGPVGVGITAV